MGLIKESCVVRVIPSNTGSTLMFGSGMDAEFRVTERVGELCCTRDAKLENVLDGDAFVASLVDAAISEITSSGREVFAELLKIRGLQVDLSNISTHDVDSNPIAFRRIGRRLVIEAGERLWQS